MAHNVARKPSSGSIFGEGEDVSWRLRSTQGTFSPQREIYLAHSRPALGLPDKGNSDQFNDLSCSCPRSHEAVACTRRARSGTLPTSRATREEVGRSEIPGPLRE